MDAGHARALLLSSKQVCGQAASDISTGLPCSAPQTSPQIVHFARAEHSEPWSRVFARHGALSGGKCGIWLFFSGSEWMILNVTYFVRHLPASASQKETTPRALGWEKGKTRASVITRSSAGLWWVRGRGSVPAPCPLPRSPLSAFGGTVATSPWTWGDFGWREVKRSPTRALGLDAEHPTGETAGAGSCRLRNRRGLVPAQLSLQHRPKNPQVVLPLCRGKRPSTGRGEYSCNLLAKPAPSM